MQLPPVRREEVQAPPLRAPAVRPEAVGMPALGEEARDQAAQRLDLEGEAAVEERRARRGNATDGRGGISSSWATSKRVI